MEREERLSALALADSESVVAVADKVLEDFDVEVSRGPTVGLLMVRMEEPSERLPFNFTEVTVSEAEVLAGDKRGYAMVMGRDPEKALAAAVLDAAAVSGHSLKEEIDALATTAVNNDEDEWKQRWSMVAPSIASFEDVTE